MGDGETLVTETSAVIDYSVAGYASTGYVDAGSNVYGSEGIGNTNYAVPTAVDGNAYLQETHVDASYGTKSVGMGGTGDNIVATGAPAVNGNIASEATGVASVENENTVENVGGTVSEKPFADGFVISGEEERLWSIVKANSLDFDAWTALIDETEKVAVDNILKIRKVYDAFLAEFPLCYGYWKKYADHEARIGSMDKVVEVYDRAIMAVTYSVDIWLHYCTFLMSTYGDPENVRSLFERALAYVGTDYLSFPLWDKYIEYEEMQANWVNVASIYTRILEIPNRRLDDYFNRFKIFAASRPLSELRTAEEAAALAPPLFKDGSESKEGETHPNESEEASIPVGTGLSEAEELEKYVAIREDIYKKAKEFDSKIADFENAIRRPYFHVRPLNIVELENWHNYLDFMEREEDLNKVVKLYERCLIACANYPEFWIRYVLCMEVFGSLDRANNALTRATQVFVKRQPEIHLFAARFKEQNGDVAGARASYQLLHTEVAPALLEATTKHANMEHRLGNLEDAFSLYEQAIAIEKGKEHSRVLPILYAQYSRFVYLVSRNVEKAREILVQGLENVQLSKPLLEALIHLESIQSQPKRIDYLDSLVDKFIGPNSDGAGSFSEREELSCIFLEFLSLFGDVPSIKRAEDRHAKLFLPHRSKSELKKRGAEDFLASDKTKIAKSYSDDSSPAQSLMGAYPSARNQWPAGYGATPQAWPPATQGQVQQWATPGYGQQAVYGAYGGYGSTYSAPPAPTSVAQTTAYGVYPPTYPVQAAFPQQSYTQPTATTAAAALPTAPQPASVPQPYYGNYY